jgi:uncharacterized membrane protein YqhA
MSDEGHENVNWPTIPIKEKTWVIRLFSSSRYFAAFAVFGAFLAAITLYVYGTLIVLRTIFDTFVNRDIALSWAKHLQVVFIELTDVYLLGTVLFIVSFGLYQLFIQPDLPIPHWLRIRSIDQLSERLIEVVGVLLGVTFLASVADDDPQDGPLEFGIAVAVVIAALSLLLVVSHRRGGTHDSA